MKVTATLDNWTVSMHSISHYILIGTVSGDIRERFPDGSTMHTSSISVEDHPIDDLKEGMAIKTMNSVYRLGAKSNAMSKAYTI